jgi:hypothetical protein
MTPTPQYISSTRNFPPLRVLAVAPSRVPSSSSSLARVRFVIARALERPRRRASLQRFVKNVKPARDAHARGDERRADPAAARRAAEQRASREHAARARASSVVGRRASRSAARVVYERDEPPSLETLMRREDKD